MKRILCLSAIALGAVGCVTPRVLVSQEMIGDRVAKFTYMRTGATGSGKDAKVLFDFGVVLCDFDNAGKETNCGDTLLMQNVTYFPIPK